MVKLNKAVLTTLFICGFIIPCFSVVTQSTPPVVGCPDEFSTSITGTNYQWDFGPNSYYESVSGASYQTGVPTVFLSAGTRTVRVTITTGGGPVVDSLVVTVQPSNSNISISANKPLCGGSYITYTATPATYAAYAFFVDDSLQELTTSNTFDTTLQTGDSVRVFGFNGTCFSNPSATLYVNTPSPPQLISSVPSDTICGGQLVVFTAIPATYDTFEFYVGGSLQQESSSNVYSTTTLYSETEVHVTVIENGCPSIYWSNIDTMFVKPTPQVTISASNIDICKGTPVTFTATGSQAPVDSFNFFLDSLSIQDSPSATYTSSTLNNDDYVYVIAEYEGCYSQQSNIITDSVVPLPTVTLTSSSANDTICQGTPVTFTANPPGYTSYEFFDGTQSVQNGSSSTYVTDTLSNNSSISVQATNTSFDCTGPKSPAITIVVNPLPVVTTPSTSPQQCVSNSSDTLTGFTPATGGTWSGTGITNDSTGIFDPSLAGPGTFSLVYSYTDPTTQCTNISTTSVTVNPLPVIDVSPLNPSICLNQSVQLTATGASVYEWSPGESLSDSLIPNPVASPLQTTTYVITGLNTSTGCTDTTSETVTVKPGPTAGFTFNQACARQATDFTNTTTPANGTTYQWQFGDGTSSTLTDPTHSYVSSDTFNVTLIAELAGCPDTVTQPVFVYPAATAAFDAFPLYTYNDSNSPVHFINQSTGAQSYVWDFGDNTTSTLTSPYHYYTNEGQYTITLVASNQYNCNDSLTVVDYITIYQAPIVFIPNAFTPGNANANNILHVFTPGAKYVDLKIFDRLGELVYSSTNANSDDPGEGWNGTFRGKNSPEGVYAYILQVVFDDNTSRQYTGSITLLR